MRKKKITRAISAALAVVLFSFSTMTAYASNVVTEKALTGNGEEIVEDDGYSVSVSPSQADLPKPDNSKIAEAAVAFAWETRDDGFGNDGTELYRDLHDLYFPEDNIYRSCDRAVAVAVHYAGADDAFPKGGCEEIINYMRGNSDLWLNIGPMDEEIVRAGDLLVRDDHIAVYAGNESIVAKYPEQTESVIVSGSIESEDLQGRSPSCTELLDDYVSGGYEIYRYIGNYEGTDDERYTGDADGYGMPKNDPDTEYAYLTVQAPDEFDGKLSFLYTFEYPENAVMNKNASDSYFTLKAGEKVTFEYLPVGTEYVITVSTDEIKLETYIWKGVIDKDGVTIESEIAENGVSDDTETLPWDNVFTTEDETGATNQNNEGALPDNDAPTTESETKPSNKSLFQKFTAKTNGITVTVTADARARIPENATLVLEVLEEGSAAYNAALESVSEACSDEISDFVPVNVYFENGVQPEVPVRVFFEFDEDPFSGKNVGFAQVFPDDETRIGDAVISGGGVLHNR